jgi:hypothetical protein
MNRNRDPRRFGDERTWRRHIDRLERNKLDDELQAIVRAFTAVDRAVQRRHEARRRAA